MGLNPRWMIWQYRLSLACHALDTLSLLLLVLLVTTCYNINLWHCIIITRFHHFIVYMSWPLPLSDFSDLYHVYFLPDLFISCFLFKGIMEIISLYILISFLFKDLLNVCHWSTPHDYERVLIGILKLNSKCPFSIVSELLISVSSYKQPHVSGYS